jgi:hypothetical protein
VSAREELFRRVAGSFVDEERANKLIDDLLHEEAEKLRKHADTMPNREWATGVLIAADLTDPKISQ